MPRRAPENTEPGVRMALVLSSADSVRCAGVPERGALTLGSGEACDLVLQGDGVAALHATVRSAGAGRLSVEPQKGCVALLNDVQLSAPSELRAGDELSLGSVRAVVVAGTAFEERLRLREPAEMEDRLEDEVGRALRLGVRFAVVLARAAGLGELGQDPQLTARGVWGAWGTKGLEVHLADGDASAPAVDAFVSSLTGLLGKGARVVSAVFPQDGAGAAALWQCAFRRLVGDGTAEEDLVVVDPVMVRLYALAEAWAQRQGPMWICGEPGVGKLRFARALEARGRPWVELECAAGTVDSVREALGRAAGGCLVLRHLDLMGAQARGAVEAAGERGEVRLLVTARGEPEPWFKGSVVALPALRDRPTEILPLAEAALAVLRKRLRPRLTLTAQARALLQPYAWPGNVRELECALGRAALATSGDVMVADALPAALRRAATQLGNTADLRSSLKATEKGVLLDALRKTHWNVTLAARQLGLPRRTVVYRLARLGLKRP